MTVFRAPIGLGLAWLGVAGTPAPSGPGLPLVGGKVTFYLAGTALGTLQGTFTTNAGTVPNANPIVLDSTGKIPSAVDVWLSGGIAYDVQITDAIGNVIATLFNIQGDNDPSFAGSLTEWILGPAATWLSATSFSLTGDQTSIFHANRRLKLVSGAGTTYATVQRTTLPGVSPTVVTIVNDGTAPTNPIGNVSYGFLDSLNTSIPWAVIPLGNPKYATDGSARTGADWFGPIGSNLQVFSAPPVVAASVAGAGVVVASAGGAGNQIVTGTVKNIVGSLTFNKTAHGFANGQLIQISTSGTLPGGVVALTGYFVILLDANNFGISLTLDGTPLAFVNAGVGNQTAATPAQVATGTVNGIAGSLTFYQPAHGLRTGEAVRIATSTTLPGNVIAATTFIVFRVDANNFGLYAVPTGWIYAIPLLDPAANPAGLTWGNPIAFLNVGVGTQTITPGWVVPPNVTRNFCRMVGGGGGGGGCPTGAGAPTAIIAGSGGGGGGCEGWQICVPGTFLPAVVGNGGLGGAQGSNAGIAGGASTFNGFTANGGSGGSANSINIVPGAAGGTANGATRNVSGTPGGVSWAFAGGSIAIAGKGGSSMMGEGANGSQLVQQTSASNQVIGISASALGGGGTPAANTNSGLLLPGGSGFAGEIDVWW